MKLALLHLNVPPSFGGADAFIGGLHINLTDELPCQQRILVYMKDTLRDTSGVGMARRYGGAPDLYSGQGDMWNAGYYLDSD
jgi:hypothetical protein